METTLHDVSGDSCGYGFPMEWRCGVSAIIREIIEGWYTIPLLFAVGIVFAAIISMY